jgi:hypothetical protein
METGHYRLSPSTRRVSSSRISSAMLVGDSRTYSASDACSDMHSRFKMKEAAN